MAARGTRQPDQGAALRTIRNDIDRKVIGFGRFIRALPADIRQSVTDQQISALQGLKLLLDDLLMVEMELLRTKSSLRRKR